MTIYSNKGGDSGISSYEIKDDEIIVQFSSGVKYLYNYTSAGSTNIEKMKELALKGEGLNSFIMRNVKTSFASKLT
jgi:hypothetical protein